VRRASTIRIYNELLPSKFAGDLKAKARTPPVERKFTGRNRPGSKAPPGRGRTPGTLGPSREFLRKL